MRYTFETDRYRSLVKCSRPANLFENSLGLGGCRIIASERRPRVMQLIDGPGCDRTVPELTWGSQFLGTIDLHFNNLMEREKDRFWQIRTARAYLSRGPGELPPRVTFIDDEGKVFDVNVDNDVDSLEIFGELCDCLKDPDMSSQLMSMDMAETILRDESWKPGEVGNALSHGFALKHIIAYLNGKLDQRVNNDMWDDCQVVCRPLKK